jgi:CheY-like chemotaxis protein
MAYCLLIVEDESAQKTAIKTCYAEEILAGTYKLLFANSGEEALEIIENNQDPKIDLIVSDLKLPAAKVNGWKFIKELANKNIDIKIIVRTAFGSPDDFSAKESKNILYFLKKEQQESNPLALKLFIQQSLSLPDKITIKSPKVRFNTLLKLIKDLPSKQKVQLMKELLSYMQLKELRQVENQVSEWIKECLEEVFQKDLVRQWLIEKEETGEFNLPVSIKHIDFFKIDVRQRPSGTYCDIRWHLDGKNYNAHIPKALSDELIPLLPPEVL